MKRSIRSRIIAAILTALMLMTLLPANAISLGGDTADTVAPESHELQNQPGFDELTAAHPEHQGLAALSGLTSFGGTDAQRSSAPEPLPAPYVKSPSGQKSSIDFDIRVGREYIILHEDTFMLSTLLSYFNISGTVSGVSSSDENVVRVEQAGSDWQITVLSRFSGIQYIYYTEGGNPTGLEIECGNAYGYIRRTWSDGQVGAYTEYAWNPENIENAGGVLTGGCYISNLSEKIIDSRIEVRGNAKLILLDGSKLTAARGIYIAEGAALEIFGGPNDSGVLYSHPSSGPGIGNSDSIAHSLMISGGTLDIKGGSGCAGIGGGGSKVCGITYVVINGGNVTTEGGSGGAGIGKGSGPENGLLMDVAINGGNVTADGGSDGAGIGGGARSDSGPIAINGGTVSIHAGQNGAGIGGGANGHQYSPVTITGGDITISVPAESGAGIGGGAGYEETMISYYGGNGGDVTINGGKLTIRLRATRSAGIGGGGLFKHGGTLNGDVRIGGGEVNIEINNGYDTSDEYVSSQGAGIGGSAERTPAGSVYISGGSVIITNNGYGAGIGGGGSEKKPSSAGNGGNVYIGGSAYVVSMSSGGAGIGGGGSLVGGGGGGNGGVLTINGGIVYAISNDKGAGVGGGNDGDGGTLIMNDGFLMASGGSLDFNYARDHGLFSDPLEGVNPVDQGWANLISNLLMHFILSGKYGGAGIGGGDDGDGGNVIINGGTVVAQAGRNNAHAIGRGDGGHGDGSLTLYNSARVWYANLDDEDEGTLGTVRVSSGLNREKNCKGNAFARITLCTHPAATYNDQGASGHTVFCDYCRTENSGVILHDFSQNEHKCSDCGYERVKITFSAGTGSGSTDPVWVTKGETYTIPERPSQFTAPDGQSFNGWSVGSDSYAPGGVITANSDMTFTARWVDPYNIWVSGVQVTDGNKNDVLGDGKVNYDPETCTLHLDGVTGFSGDYKGALIYANRVNLTVTGSGEIVPIENTSCSDGIKVNIGSLTINGDFKVSSSLDTGTGTMLGNGLNASKDIVFAGGNILIRASGKGVRTDRNICVKNGVERLEVKTDSTLPATFALDAANDIYLDNSLFITEVDGVVNPPQNIHVDSRKHVVIERGVIVTFKLNGGNINGIDDDYIAVIRKNSIVTPPDDPAREELDFGGWYSDEAFTHAFDLNSQITEDVTVWARWTISYSVVIHWSDYEEAPQSVAVAMQRASLVENSDGSFSVDWRTVQTVLVDNEGDNWSEIFLPVTYVGDNTEDLYRIREMDMNYEVVLGEDDVGADDDPLAVYQVREVVPDPEPEPDPDAGTHSLNALSTRAITFRKVAYAVRYVLTGRRFVEIYNTNNAVYSVENTWDTDLNGQDKPEEIQVALQRRNNWISWESVEVLTLNAGNGWSGTFAQVPVGRVDQNGRAEVLEYRIRQLTAPEENAPQPVTEAEVLADADSRTVYDTWDFDKPFLKNLLAQLTDPMELWTLEFTMSYLQSKVTKAVIPVPAAVYHIDEYTDWIGKTISAHDSRFYVTYDFKKETKKMSLTNINVLEISIYKRWINFEDDEMPESVYLMLESKVNDEYAQRLGLEGVNIYTPVLTAVYGDRFDISKVTGLNSAVTDGIKELIGDNIAATAINTVVGTVISMKFVTGIAVTEVNGDKQNPLTRWRCVVGVKKYGGYGVPMEFAGTELVTGFMEMAVDGVLKYVGLDKIHVPVMYDPINGCWSIKGYAVNYPVIDKDWQQTCNVINIKIHSSGNDDDNNVISGEKKWENDDESSRPDDIRLHIYVKDGDTREECIGSPITVSKNDDWKWSFEVPRGQLMKFEGEGEDTTAVYKAIEIEEEVPEGYSARYESNAEERTYNVINSKIAANGGLSVKVFRSADDAAAEDTFIFRIERAQSENGGNGGAGGGTAAVLTVAVTLGANVTEGGITINGLGAGQYVVRCENGWSWRYDDLTDVTVTVESGATAEARFDAELNNKNWLFGNCSGSLEPSSAAQQNSSSQQALPNDNKARKP